MTLLQVMVNFHELLGNPPIGSMWGLFLGCMCTFICSYHELSVYVSFPL